MNNIKSLFHKALASLMLTGLCLCFVTSVSVAQCPTDIHPLPGETGYMGWTSSTGTFIIPGTTDCQVIFHYCYRSVNGIEQVYIVDYGPDHTNWGGDCNPLWKDLLVYVREHIFQNESADPCGQGVTTVATIISSQCAKWVMNSYGYPVCEFCGTGAYCEKTCDLCNNGTDITESNCTYTSLNTGSCDAIDDWTTLTVNAVKVNSWSHDYDHCYLIGCTY